MLLTSEIYEKSIPHQGMKLYHLFSLLSIGVKGDEEYDREKSS
jgi:hypothetical protein